MTRIADQPIRSGVSITLTVFGDFPKGPYVNQQLRVLAQMLLTNAVRNPPLCTTPSSAMKLINAFAAGVLAAATAFSVPAFAGAIRNAGLFTTVLPANDDGSTGMINTGFSLNFFGTSFSSLFVNNNGNVTFDAALPTFTPFPLINTPRQLLAPFFADVDTRGTGNGLTMYGASTIGGMNVFGVNWINVGYFAAHTDKLNSFQLIITDRSDLNAGDFDFEFNYDKIQWNTGDASGGSGGLGGDPARVGWSNGSTASYEQAGSAINGAFLDGGPFSLIAGSLNSNGVAGRYIFNVRNGAVLPPEPTVPEPASLALVAAALLAAGAATRRRNRS